MNTSQVRHETLMVRTWEFLGVQPLYLGTEFGWDGYGGAGRQKLGYKVDVDGCVS